MSNKLPFDDEQALNDDNNSMVEEIPQENDDADYHKTLAALNYIKNGNVDVNNNQQEPDQSMVGKMVGAKYSNPSVMASTAPVEIPKSIPQEVQSVEPNNDDAEPEKTSSSPQQSLLDQYRQLMKQQQEAKQNLNYNMAGNQIAQAIASGYGAKIGDGSEQLNQLRKQTELPMEEFMGQQKVAGLKNDLEINDPNSDISAFAREQALQAMQRLNPNMTPEQVEKLKGQFESMTAKQLEQAGFKGLGGMSEYQRNMLEMQKQRLGYLGDNLNFKKEAQSAKLSKEDSDLAQKMQKSLDAMTASGRTELGRLSRVASSARQLDLMLTNKKPEDFDNRDMQELAIITNSMLSGGQTTAVSAINKLVPKTFGGDTARFLEYIQNQPQSADAQDFVKSFKKIADREKISSDLGLRKILGSNVNAFYKLRETQPDVYQNIIDSKLNLNSDLNNIYGDKNILKKSAQSTTPNDQAAQPQIKQDPKILNYAQQHNLDYTQAKAILTGRGYKPNEQ